MVTGALAGPNEGELPTGMVFLATMRPTTGDRNRRTGEGCEAVGRTACSAQFLIDDGFKLIKGLCANNGTTVDKEGGRSIGPFTSSLCKISIDVGFVFAAIKGLLEAFDVQAEFFGPSDVVITVQVAEVGEQLVMEFQNLPCSCAAIEACAAECALR